MAVSRRVLIRFAIWIPLLLAVVAWRLWSDWRAARSVDDESIEATWSAEQRRATPEEWQRDIAELGEQRLAKRIKWQLVHINEGNGGVPVPRGTLVWWHDGTQERLAYLPAPGEDPSAMAPALGIALSTGRAVVYRFADDPDPDLHARITGNELPVDFQLPPGWTVLRHPEG